jgi:Na+/H+-dicarboxylate symporter
MNLDLILLVFAFVLFVCAAAGVPSPRVNLLAAGLAAWVATLLF